MSSLLLSQLKEKNGVGFGTSGIRAKNEELSDRVCYAYTKAFLEYLNRIEESKDSVAIAGDLRESTPRIMKAVTRAALDCGYKVINCGKIPTPAVIYFAISKHIPSIMVTGSHIPAERNGIKFNKSIGEILKADEKAISAAQVLVDDNLFDEKGMFKEKMPDLPIENEEAYKVYVRRYLDFFKANLLKGKRIGFYEHSSVGKKVVKEVLECLGAEVVELEDSSTFVPIDSEVISAELVEKGKKWSQEFGLEALLSTDGDSDRPLVADENGHWIRSDVLGIFITEYLKIRSMAVPVSCNTALEKSGVCERVERTRIGSPYVIEAMIKLEKASGGPVAGYEANGGYLLGSPVENTNGKLAALPTRDAMLVLLGVLALSQEKGVTLGEMVKTLPSRYTQSTSVKDFPTAKSLQILQNFSQGSFEDQQQKLEPLFRSIAGTISQINLVDGLRMLFNNEEIIHLRPSMNAPEFRVYTEAGTPERAEQLCRQVRGLIEAWKKETI